MEESRVPGRLAYSCSFGATDVTPRGLGLLHSGRGPREGGADAHADMRLHPLDGRDRSGLVAAPMCLRRGLEEDHYRGLGKLHKARPGRGVASPPRLVATAEKSEDAQGRSKGGSTGKIQEVAREEIPRDQGGNRRDQKQVSYQSREVFRLV